VLAERVRTIEDPARVYEPARRSLRVELMMRVANRVGARTAWPDYAGRGIQLSRGEYDYDNRGFWAAFGGVVTEADLKGKDLLDVGCGWAGKTVRYAEHGHARHVAGFDLPGTFDPEVARAFARERGVEDACDFTTGYAESIPYGDSQFDVAMMDDVLEHVADPEKVLQECARVLRPGGLLIVRFPSIRMIRAHHFDRAITLPGMHYLAGMQTWAAGLNYYREHNAAGVSYTPFLRVKRSAFGRVVTSDLSGLDWRSFRSLVERSRFETKYLAMSGMPPHRRESTTAPVRWTYESLRSVPWLRERLSSSIAFVGVLPSTPGRDAERLKRRAERA
jgi:2-polyprenyl-3-methyl-5-hydroxy-6-metoxy-1,4-benzoquinol methylase